MINPLIAAVEQAHLKTELPAFKVGDTVDVHCRIKEGEKERVQVFTGDVLMFKGRGVTRTFTVRRIVNNEGVERIFPVHSPNVIKVEVRRKGRARRAKLLFLRDRVGKSARVKEQKLAVTKKQAAQAAAAAAGA